MEDSHGLMLVRIELDNEELKKQNEGLKKGLDEVKHGFERVETSIKDLKDILLTKK